MLNRPSRRRFLRTGAAASAAIALPDHVFAAPTRPARPRVGVIFTQFTYRSHAHVIMENFLGDYWFNGKRTEPGVEVVSMFGDQFPSGDMSRDVARQFKIPIYESINDALCCGGDELAVDAVLSIGEHGSYPSTKLGQRMYPRKRFFDEAIAVMKKSKRFVPLFNDKHLSYRWDWAKEMYDTSQELGVPLLAGSSVPLAQRRPEFDMKAGAEIEEAVSIHGGPLESYDFHGLEVLQSLVEFRKGGETGVSRVELLEGDAVWKAAKQGRWSPKLAQAAMAAETGEENADLRKLQGEHSVHVLLLEYKDGLKAAVFKLGRLSTRWNFACRLKDGKTPATSFHVGPWENRCLFKALSHAIQHHFRTGKPPYPVERTLLVTGTLEAAMRARHAGQPLATPHLEFPYAARDFTPMRERGASWKIVTPSTPQPKGLDPGPKK